MQAEFKLELRGKLTLPIHHKKVGDWITISELNLNKSTMSWLNHWRAVRTFAEHCVVGAINEGTVGLVSDVENENGGFICQGQQATLTIESEVPDHPDLADRTVTEDIEGEIVWVNNGLYLEDEDGNHYQVADFDNWTWTAIDQEGSE